VDKTKKKLAASLSAPDTGLIPHIPYLLQDLWELGSDPKDIIALAKKHVANPAGMAVLDLACGKGAVSVSLAKTYGCRVKGIDIMPEFIKDAQKKAAKYSVENLCSFITADINKAVKKEKNYDMAIYGASGAVLGNQKKTLSLLKSAVRPGGYIFLDEAYSSAGPYKEYLPEKTWQKLFKAAGLKLLDEKPVSSEKTACMNKKQQALIIKRARQLKKKYPAKAALFDGYMLSQAAECADLENELTAVTWLLRAG
jgi:ubiquinone/menaquinone biosynthesis C-methylase UbiE